MKRILFIALIMLLPSSVAFAGPWLTCDCTPEVDAITSFQVSYDGGAYIDTPAVMTCRDITCTGASRTMCMDMAPLNLSNGSHNVKGRSLNLWGASPDSLPLAFVKGGPSSSPFFKIKP